MRGALADMLDASREAFAAQQSAIRARLLAGTALQSDETGLRVGKTNWWLWAELAKGSGKRSLSEWPAEGFHFEDSAVFHSDP